MSLARRRTLLAFSHLRNSFRKKKIEIICYSKLVYYFSVVPKRKREGQKQRLKSLAKRNFSFDFFTIV